MGNTNITQSIPGELVKKDNRLIRAKINITSLDASRILANLIACIHVEDKELAQTYRVVAADFLNLVGGGNYIRIKKICRELVSASAELDEGETPNNHLFIARPFFTEIRYKKGIIEASFNPKMSDMLINLKKCFTKYNLAEYLSLPSVYSQRIFEILKSWDDKPEIIISLEELHNLLNCPDSFKSDFFQFRKYVLDKAYKDITEKTNFKYEWEPIKYGRAVEKIRFIFSKKRRLMSEENQNLLKEEKKRRLDRQRMGRALACAKNKKGLCEEQDNKRIVCKMCLYYHLCDEIKKMYTEIPRP